MICMNFDLKKSLVVLNIMAIFTKENLELIGKSKYLFRPNDALAVMSLFKLTA